MAMRNLSVKIIRNWVFFSFYSLFVQHHHRRRRRHFNACMWPMKLCSLLYTWNLLRSCILALLPIGSRSLSIAGHNPKLTLSLSPALLRQTNAELMLQRRSHSHTPAMGLSCMRIGRSDRTELFNSQISNISILIACNVYAWNLWQAFSLQSSNQFKYGRIRRSEKSVESSGIDLVNVCIRYDFHALRQC